MTYPNPLEFIEARSVAVLYSGACSLWTILSGALTKEQLRTHFTEMQKEAALHHGECSGGWNMMSGLKFKDTSLFATVQEAVDYLLENTEKWENALAVRARDSENREVWVIGGWAAD